MELGRLHVAEELVPEHASSVDHEGRRHTEELIAVGEASGRIRARSGR